MSDNELIVEYFENDNEDDELSAIVSKIKSECCGIEKDVANHGESDIIKLRHGCCIKYIQQKNRQKHKEG